MKMIAMIGVHGSAPRTRALEGHVHLLQQNKRKHGAGETAQNENRLDWRPLCTNRPA
jgi:hypothetical protein